VIIVIDDRDPDNSRLPPRLLLPLACAGWANRIHAVLLPTRSDGNAHLYPDLNDRSAVALNGTHST
jgi:hypothetical protein